MTRHLAWLPVLAVAACGQAPADETRVPPPDQDADSAPLVIDEGTFLDLGRRAPGSTPVELHVRNRSSRAVRVEQITLSCGCAGAKFDDSRPLDPGEARPCVVELRIDAGITRTVVAAVRPAAGAPVTAILKFTGSDEGVTYPRELDLGTVAGGEAEGRLVASIDPSLLRSALSESDRLEQQWTVEDDSRVAFDPDPVPASAARGDLPVVVAARVRVRPATEGPGAAVAVVTIGRSVTFRTRLRWTATRAVDLDASSVVLEPRGPDLEGTVWLALRDGTELVAARVDDDRVTASLERRGRRVGVRVRAPAAWRDGDGVTTLRLQVSGTGGEITETLVPVAAGL